MPLIRCQWFDDKTQPIDGGCRWESTTCDFIHPSSHLWNSAVRKKTAIPRSLMGPRKGPQSWSDAPRRANISGANTTGLGARSHSMKSPPTGPALERTSWDTGQWYQNSRKSGQSDAGPSTSTQTGASATAWGTTTDWANSPPHKTQDVGFASPAWGGTKDSEGTWGGIGWGNRGKDNASAGTWDSSRWGTSDAGIGLEKVPAEEPQPMQVDSSPSTPKGYEKEIARRDSQDTIMLPALTDPTTTSSHIPLPKKRKDPGKQRAVSLTVDVSGSGSRASDQPHSPSHLFTDAQNVYKEVMKLFFKLVRLKIEKSEHEGKHRAWTAVQSSQPYSLGQNAGGIHWNQAQKESDTIHSINRNIEDTQKKLLNLPDVSTPNISLDEMEEKMEQITKYTADVDLWMKQLAEAQDEAERKAAEAAAESYPIDIAPHWKPEEWPENPSMEYFQRRIAELQDQVNDLSDFLDHKKSMDDVDSLFEESIQKSDSLARLTMEELDPEDDPLTLRLDNAGGQIVEMMSTIAEYTSTFVDQEDEFERWKAERDANLAVKAELEEKIADFEKRSQERRTYLQEMSDELRELRQMEQAYPFQLIDPLLEQIATEVIEKEVEPVLVALRAACEAASTQSADKITQKLEVAAQPMVESNHRLREQARRSRATTSS
ncbi:hypothetical protein IW261DRAFT_1434311 [Armillaria novae-zelandiae]|uniref:C3H1-type domain-containing protein n=1 Tax=Armillaria novae-zelandiae TaxID=153914 RepID=A0AA39USD4_9AGAR|nr:hypothetical protein IW261DRAFT_1434311 [Armillaria novae-zelandiae]